MNRPSADMGQTLGYLAFLSKYMFFLRCPSKGRPKDCIHPCPRYVHSGPCEPCTKFVELECYCEATGIVKPCKEWCDMEESQKELIKCCRVRCAKIMECGHQCPQICHQGKCADPKECVENVIRYCDCERIERIFPCRGCGAKDQEVPCDNICAELLKTYKQAIAEMKNNPFKHQDANKNPNPENAASSCEEELGVEAEELSFPRCILSVPENKHESESESGFNEDNKNSEDDRAETESALDDAILKPIEQSVGDSGLGSPASYRMIVPATQPSENLEPSGRAVLSCSPATHSFEQPSSLAVPADPPYASLDSEDFAKKMPLNRVSRSSSRVSNYSEEDIPRQLDQDKIVKIMRSSTRRKKLIKCDQSEVINEMQSSS